jgi:hypothetical protein
MLRTLRCERVRDNQAGRFVLRESAAPRRRNIQRSFNAPWPGRATGRTCRHPEQTRKAADLLSYSTRFRLSDRPSTARRRRTRRTEKRRVVAPPEAHDAWARSLAIRAVCCAADAPADRRQAPPAFARFVRTAPRARRTEQRVALQRQPAAAGHWIDPEGGGVAHARVHMPSRENGPRPPFSRRNDLRAGRRERLQ